MKEMEGPPSYLPTLWKLRRPCPSFQRIPSPEERFSTTATLRRFGKVVTDRLDSSTGVGCLY